MHDLLERNSEGQISPLEREQLESLVEMAEFASSWRMPCARPRREPSAIPKALRTAVLERDAGRRTYCSVLQVGQSAVFHIDHVTPRSKGGVTEASIPLQARAFRCFIRCGSGGKVISLDCGR
jgi:hypothetical protein